METVILAGGLGTRLRSVVPDLPKPMAPVDGRPFLEYLLDFWIGRGASRFILAVGYRREAIISHFGRSYKGVPVDYAVEETPLGTGVGLFRSLEKIGGEESFLVANGDTFFDFDLAPISAMHEGRNAALSMVLRAMPEAGRFGTVELFPDGRIERFCPPGQGTSPFLINGGGYLVEPTFLRGEKMRWDGKSPLSLESDLFPAWIASGHSLYGIRGEGEFIDIGIPEEYNRCGDLFRKRSL